MGKIAHLDATKALAMDSGLTEAYVVLGMYNRLVALASPLQRTLARMLFGGLPKGSLQDSERLLKRALELSPENVYAHLEFGRTLIARKDTADAELILEKMQAMPEVWHLDRRLKAQGLSLLAEIRKK
jgi:thioredoxin-like negative regulator of GroEL